MELVGTIASGVVLGLLIWEILKAIGFVIVCLWVEYWA